MAESISPQGASSFADAVDSYDPVIINGELGSNQVQLRAERSGTGDGRVYVISFTVADGNGGECSGGVTIGVPHDMRGTPAVDSGQIVNSYGP
jgi:hypothetical protein